MIENGPSATSPVATAPTTAPPAPATAPPSSPPPAAPRRATARDRWASFGRPPRVVGIDVARGLAIIGMIGAHVGVSHDLVWSEPSTWGAIVHGRSSILFAVVAGISLALLTPGIRDAHPKTVRTARLRLLGRAGIVFALGLGLELISSMIAIILCVYGVLFLVGIPFLRWRRRSLLIAAGLLAVVGPLITALIPVVGLTSWGSGVGFVLYGTYPVQVWLVYLLVGMAIGRSDLRSMRLAATAVAVGVVLAVAGYTLGAASASWYAVGGSSGPAVDSGVATDGGGEMQTLPGSDVDLDGLTCDIYGEFVNCYPPDAVVGPDEPVTGEGLGDRIRALIPQVLMAEPHSGGIGEIVGSGGFAVAVIGLSLLLARGLRRAVLPIAALGSMPLSVYTLHVLSYESVVRFFPTAMGVPFGVGSVLVLAALATAWSLLGGKGPLERLVVRVADSAALVVRSR